MSSQNFQKVTHGFGVRTTTAPSLPSNALVDAFISVMNTEMGTCTVTANANITYTDPISGVATTYLAGDVLFYSDGTTIWNSLDAVMFDAGAVGTGKTGGRLGLPQPVNFYKVPSTLTAGHPGKTDAFFWGFFNSGEFGIYTGLIDMTLNNGKGGFHNYENSAQSTQCGGSAPLTDLGALNNSCSGTSGCMTTNCVLDAGTGANIGVNIYTLGYDQSAAPTALWQGYYHTKLMNIMPAGAAGAGFPDLTSKAGVYTKIGLGISELQEAGMQMTMKVTPSLQGSDMAKVAVIIRPGTGSAGTPDHDAQVEVVNIDTNTSIYTNATNMAIAQHDTGTPSGAIVPRWYAMDLEWSHTSTPTNALLYYPSLDGVAPAFTRLYIHWHFLDTNNVWSPVPVTGSGSWELLDNSGAQIWGGGITDSRIIAGMWRDPSQSGRIFVNTPEVRGLFPGPVLSTSTVWSMNYPEHYGSLVSPNPIQHYIINSANSPATVIHSFFGTIDPSAYLTYGAPSFTACDYGATASYLLVGKCEDANQFVVDTANNLHRMDTFFPITGGDVNQIATPALNNFVDISANNYYGTVYIFDINAVSGLLQYHLYNERLGTIAAPVAITDVVAKGWTSVEKIKYYNWIIGGGVAPTPTTSLICSTHTFIGIKAGSAVLFALGTLDTTTNLVSTYSATSQIDISSALGGVLAGKPCVGLASMRLPDVTTVNAITYAAFGDRIIKFTHATNTWALLGGASGLATNWTSLYTYRQGGGNTPQLMATVGLAGANLVYDINLTTGALTLSGTGVIENDPGGFPFAGQVAGITTRNSTDFFVGFPVKVDFVEAIFSTVSNNCKDELVWLWSDTSHVGCFTCIEADSSHSLTEACGTLLPSTTYSTCRACPIGHVPSCETFLPCCNDSGIGPMILPGVITQTPGVLTPGNVYSVSSGGATPECGTLVIVEAEGPELWFSTTSGKMFKINILSGNCSVPSWSAIHGNVTGLRDIAFDKHGNLVYTNDVTQLQWASPWVGYESPASLLSSTYLSLECLDTDYTAANHIVGGAMQFGTATFTRHTNVAGVLTQTSSLTNATISIGYDLSVDYNSGDYFVLGDQTGGGALNDIVIIDNATAANTFLADLDVVLGWVSGEQARGIERIRLTGPVSENYIISMTVIGATHLELDLHILNDQATGLAQPVIPLINPVTGTLEWDLLDEPNGLAAQDLCSKWPNNVDPVTVPYVDCPTCINDPLTSGCCYVLTECITTGGSLSCAGAVIYSQQVILDPFVGQVVRLNIPGLGDVCYCVERSTICISPTTVFLAASPGPYPDCIQCDVPAPVYYKLTNCNNGADVLYSDDILMPTLPFVLPPNVVQLDGECFCREVAINPLGPSGTEAVYVILSTIADCLHCRFYIKLINCLDGTVLFVDYNNSPTIAAEIGLGNAFDISLSGVPQPDCYEIDGPCLGPTVIIYPTGEATTIYPNCNDCANAGLTCHEIRWCCDPSVVTIVHETTNITGADVGLVVTADITILGVLYTGCWDVTACAGPCCGLAIPDADVNTIASSTFGTGALADCLDCLVSPCNDPCVLLKACDVTNPDITVSGGQGAAIGTDVVSFVGIPGCYYVCTANLIHGTYWFWGGQSGIDWAAGTVAALNLSGASNTTTASASQTTNYCWRSSTVHCSDKLVTFGAVTYLPGDLFFYSDGKYVYDSTHTLMTDQTGAVLPVGTPLLAGGGGGGYLNTNSASQQCITVPAPAGGKTNGVYNQYYLFYQTIKNGPLYSCIIDMTLNGGRGQVTTLSKDNIVAAASCEALTSTNTQAITEEWFVYDLPVMTSCTDWTNQYVRGHKIDAGGIGPAFIAVDMVETYFFGSVVATGTGLDSMARCKLKVDYQNRQLGILAMGWNGAASCTTPTNLITMTTVYSMEMVNGTATGPGGATEVGFNGTTSQIVVRYYSNQEMWMRDFEFSRSGNNLWTMLGDQDIVGFGNCCKLERINLIDAFTSGVANQNATIYNSTQICELPGEPPFTASTPGDGAHGWDMQLAPDGKIYCVVNQGNNTQSWTLPSGNQPNNTSLLVIEDPDMTTIPGPTYAALDLSAFNLGSRHIGTGLPTYLSTACPCDQLNITTPVVSNTLLSCSDPFCSGPGTGAYQITECICTGGAANNMCAVNDPNTMPANMITYGKSWSPTCFNTVEQRWPELANAIQALGTQAIPGTAQTITMTYSFIAAGGVFTTIPWLAGSQFGPSVAVETLPAATGTFWDGANCLTFNKTYQQTHVQWKAEMASMFNEIKLLFEGMFNTTCGYGADLTINFTDLGYESGSADFNANIANPGNGTSFTDVNGITGIGDFRIGMSDFGFLDSGCTTGSASNILALCFNAPLTSAVIGTNKPTPLTGTLLFDVNEDWRSDVMGQVVVGNTFSAKKTGLHEILHAFGFGHDIFTFGGVGPAGDCTALCGCPCYQGAPGCPGLNMCEDPPMSGNWVPCCPGAVPNPDALMGPFSNQNSFATDFPTGLLGPEGIYDRRATCGIYGNPSLTWGCEDGTCLQGCAFVTYYSNDPDLAPYLNGTIIWDNLDPAGERCWEVEWVNPLPPAAVITANIPFTSGNANSDCIACDPNNGNDCYELNLCACQQAGSGAPAQITTDTDLSAWCNGTIGNGTTVEIDLWPGVCYEINCVPVPCGMAPTTVAITATYQDCNDCCLNNQTCYELCPCDNIPPACVCNQDITMGGLGQPASGFTLLAPTAFVSEAAAFAFYTTFANGFTSTPFYNPPTSNGLAYYSATALNPATACPVVPGDGSELRVYATLSPYTIGACTPNIFTGGPWMDWADIIADPISAAAGAVISDNFPAWQVKMLAFYGCPAGVVRGTNFCEGSTVIVPTSNNCSASVGTFISAVNPPYLTSALHFISTPANGLLSTVMGMPDISYQILSAPPGNPDWCYDPVTGVKQIVFSGIALYTNLLTPWPGMTNMQWQRWDLFLAEMVVAGYATVGDTFNDLTLNANYIAQQAIQGRSISNMEGPCTCTGTQPALCTTVTNDLSGNIGDVVQIGPGSPAPLVEGECYIVGECGPCTTAPADPCTPVGAATIIGPFIDCPTCEIQSLCDCYMLTHCTNGSVINNVCASVDLANAEINGDIIQINGDTTNCYHVACDTPTHCNPVTCVTVAVTSIPGFVSCQACATVPTWNYICHPTIPCDCEMTTDPGYVDCATMFANEPLCCPNQPVEYECEPTTCNCVPCLVPPCPAYNVGPTSADNLAACMADVTGCCNTNNSVTYDCLYNPSSPVYTCVDPGNGMGYFTGATALVDCNAAVAANTQPCAIPSWGCDSITGQCTDPGDGSGPFNDSNGGFAACVSCVGCALDPSCPGTVVSYDCDPVYGCIQNWLGTGDYPNINSCVQYCADEDPDPGTFEGDCVNCLEEVDMKVLFEKVSDMCEECNVPYGLTEQETTCEVDCFTGNLYVVLDVTSVFTTSNQVPYQVRLTEILNFKATVLVPAFNRIKQNNPSYTGHLYILLGAYPFDMFGMCFDNNNTGAQVPSAGANTPENWLQWVQYPLSGNAGASGLAPTPFIGGSLPASQRVAFANTMVDAVGGAPWVCNGGAYDPAVHKSLMEQIIILPGSYTTDGFTQTNPWQDPAGTEGMSDPYHEFEGGDIDSKVIVFTDEANNGYYEGSGNVGVLDMFANPIGVCGAPLTNGVPSVNWNGYGLGAGSLLTSQWKNDYTNYMSLHQYGWDINGGANPTTHTVTQRAFVYAGAANPPGDWSVTVVSRWKFRYHLYQAIGGSHPTVSAQGHVSCAQYRPIPAVYGQQAYAITDPTIPNMYMGATGGGDPTLTTGYKGGSLSNYGIDFHIPSNRITDLTEEALYGLIVEYLTDC